MKDINEQRFYFRLTCAECGALLNTSHEVGGSRVMKLYSGLALASPLMAGSCPRGCRPTFSDCNLRTRMEIIDAATGKAIKVEAFQFLGGHFYRDDYAKVCECERAEDEVYRSENYPAVHGPCGRWLEPFTQAWRNVAQ